MIMNGISQASIVMVNDWGKKVLFISGFEITIEHPHTDVVKCTQLVRGK